MILTFIYSVNFWNTTVLAAKVDPVRLFLSLSSETEFKKCTTKHECELSKTTNGELELTQDL